MAWWCYETDKTLEPSQHEPFISTHQRHADPVTQMSSLFQDNGQTVKKALEGHGPDIQAHIVNSPELHQPPIDMITVIMDGYCIEFEEPSPKDGIGVLISKGENSYPTVVVYVKPHKTMIEQDDHNGLAEREKSIGMDTQQAEDLADRTVRLVLDTAGKNWPQ
jgi:hypothetical protein